MGDALQAAYRSSEPAGPVDGKSSGDGTAPARSPDPAIEPAGQLPTFEHPHGWTWRNEMPSSIHVEPAFLKRLGAVFVCIDHNGKRLGVWLPEPVMQEFIAAMRRAAHAYDEAGDG